MTALKKFLFEKMYNTMNQLGKVETKIWEHRFNRECPTEFELAEQTRLTTKRKKLESVLEKHNLLDEYWNWDFYYRIFSIYKS